MAFRTNSLQQYSFSDAVYNLTERERKALEKSWAKVFAEEIFPAIDEERFRVLYSDRGSIQIQYPGQYHRWSTDHQRNVSDL